MGMMWVPLAGQTPFVRTGQVFLVSQTNQELVDFVVHPSFNTLDVSPLGPLPAGGLEAIGFRKTDNLLYGINPGNNHLVRVGQNGVAQDLGTTGLDNALYYLAGDVSPDGKYLVSIGSKFSGPDVHLAKTDLESPAFSTQITPLNGNSYISDIAFDPYSDKLFGFDVANRCMVSINANTGFLTPFPPIGDGNTVFGLYFDAFGDLYGYGSTLYGVVDALFRIDKNTGKETRLTTGPVEPVTDAAACPFSIELKNRANPEITLPCTEVVYDYTFANGSGALLSGIDFSHALPAGFHFAGMLQNPFGVPVDTLSQPGVIRLDNLTLPPGMRQMSFKISVDDVPKGVYKNQAFLEGLPALYGARVVADNPRTAGFEDSTLTNVNRFEEDSLFYNWFICHGESVELDGSDYGGNIHWSTGSTNPLLQVTQGGVYTLEAGSTCEMIVVRHDVTSASCPFTISVSHSFVPDTVFPCGEVVLRFILDNDSGEPRSHIAFTDTLPAGFIFKAVLQNPFGGKLKPGMPPGLICLDSMLLPVGKDTLDILVEVGDAAPGIYKNRALLHQLPVVMGPIRWSDDPRTPVFDSTSVTIAGTLSDSLFLRDTICRNAAITLDASALGKHFLWEDGSTEPTFLVTKPGDYQLTLLDGCYPSEVFWHVVEGALVYVAPIDPVVIHQGEQVALNPLIFNLGSTQEIAWTDPLGVSLSCLDCPAPVAMPLESTVYSVVVSNGVCSDSAFVAFEVDQSRRIYVPNIFSPNDDGNNDYFYLQSPDFGTIRSLEILDRWGNIQFASRTAVFNDPKSGWDGRRNGKAVPEGVYLWKAEIEFIDGIREVLVGNVTVVW